MKQFIWFEFSKVRNNKTWQRLRSFKQDCLSLKTYKKLVFQHLTYFWYPTHQVDAKNLSNVRKIFCVISRHHWPTLWVCYFCVAKEFAFLPYMFASHIDENWQKLLRSDKLLATKSLLITLALEKVIVLCWFLFSYLPIWLNTLFPLIRKN